MNLQTPRGTYDILPEEMGKWHYVESVVKDVAEKYRYHEIRTPYIELTPVFARENDSSDMVNKEMYTFQPGNTSYTLRPEGTAGVIRSFVQHKFYGSMELPAKFYYYGPMFRHETPQHGRQRQFTQFGVENIGAKSPLIDAETIALGVDIVKKMGISSVKVCVNTLGDDASREAYREALRSHFSGCIDELCGDCHRRLRQNPLRILDCKTDHDHPRMKDAPKLSDYLNEESKTYFAEVLEALDQLGIPYEVDERLVRGLDYYTHTVFEVQSTHPDRGMQSTIFAGGRYDHLVQYFGGPELSGIGFAIGIERLLALAEEEGFQFASQEDTDIYVIGLGNVKSAPLQIAQDLRKHGYLVEVNLQPRSLKAQFKSADRSKAKYIVIVGEEELKQHTVNLKNTMTKEQVTIPMQEIANTIKQQEEV